MPDGLNDTTGQGLNFDTLRPQREVLSDYVTVVRTVMDPARYCERLVRLAHLLDYSGRSESALNVVGRYDVGGITALKALIDRMPYDGRRFWRTFLECQAINPRATKAILMLMVAYLHRRFYRPAGRPMRACHPRDLLEQVTALCRCRGIKPVITRELIDAACASYFVDQPNGNSAEMHPSEAHPISGSEPPW